MELGIVAKKTISIPFTEMAVTINIETAVMMFISISIVFVLAYVLSRNLQKVPGRRQAVTESLIGGFDQIVLETMGKDGRKFYPLIMTLFIYIVISNWLGMIPLCKSPTEDLNTCISMALVVFIISHVACIRKKGLKEYIKIYFDPFWFFFPLNVLGELGKTLSHCFRLFGNIFGGGIIFALVSFVTFKIAASFGAYDISEITSFAMFNKESWISYLMCSPFIIFFFILSYGFFGLFAGTIQALVFTMLALTYIAVVLEDE